MPSPHSVTISIPATSANLGPGFDCFGVALTLNNNVTLQKEKELRSHSPMIEEAAAAFFKKTNLVPFPFSISIAGDVPSSRGLGSSVTVRLGILQGLNELTNHPLTSLELYHLCSNLEGHGDNAAAALFGGFTMARAHQEPLRYPIASELFFILVIPDFEVSTAAARQLLPTTIPTGDAAANAADAAVIAVAFATQNYTLLRRAFHDRLHQPYRLPLVTFLPKVIACAEAAGALGGWLSGSGSTIALLAEKSSLANSVIEALSKVTPPATQVVLARADNQGVRVIDTK
ncbi:MAG: homoserine kinase [Chthoniobacterales bacterium]|nr:homoserine kinase [Chthoniobacterales bacterium]